MIINQCMHNGSRKRQEPLCKEITILSFRRFRLVFLFLVLTMVSIGPLLTKPDLLMQDFVTLSSIGATPNFSLIYLFSIYPF